MSKSYNIKDPIECGRFCAMLTNYIASPDAKPLYVKVSDKKPVTSQQHAYYRGVVLPSALDCYSQAENQADFLREVVQCSGMELSPEYVHTHLKRLFSKYSSTAENDTQDMANFIDEIIAHFATEYGWEIPDAE